MILAGCGSSCPVATVKGCLTKAEYETELASAVEDIGSSPSLEGRWGLEAINVAEAWAHLRVVRGTEQPGLGVTVGVIDTGIDLSHPTFQERADAGKITEEFRLGAVDETGVELSHGTGVASIIAGRVNPMYTYPFTGIAPYATLKMFAIPPGDPPPPDVPIAPVELSALAMYDEGDADLYRDALSQDLDVLNLSFGVPGLIENYDDVPALRASLPMTIEVLAQSDRKRQDEPGMGGRQLQCIPLPPGRGQLRRRHGNRPPRASGRPAGLQLPDLFAGLMARIEELRGHSIAAVATGEDGEIAFFSTRCGIAANWCIAAPGFRVRGRLFRTVPRGSRPRLCTLVGNVIFGADGLGRSRADGPFFP